MAIYNKTIEIHDNELNGFYGFGAADEYLDGLLDCATDERIVSGTGVDTEGAIEVARVLNLTTESVRVALKLNLTKLFGLDSTHEKGGNATGRIIVDFMFTDFNGGGGKHSTIDPSSYQQFADMFTCQQALEALVEEGSLDTAYFNNGTPSNVDTFKGISVKEAKETYGLTDEEYPYHGKPRLSFVDGGWGYAFIAVAMSQNVEAYYYQIVGQAPKAGDTYAGNYGFTIYGARTVGGSAPISMVGNGLVFKKQPVATETTTVTATPPAPLKPPAPPKMPTMPGKRKVSADPLA